MRHFLEELAGLRRAIEVGLEWLIVLYLSVTGDHINFFYFFSINANTTVELFT